MPTPVVLPLPESMATFTGFAEKANQVSENRWKSAVNKMESKHNQVLAKMTKTFYGLKHELTLSKPRRLRPIRKISVMNAKAKTGAINECPRTDSTVHGRRRGIEPTGGESERTKPGNCVLEYNFTGKQRVVDDHVDDQTATTDTVVTTGKRGLRENRVKAKRDIIGDCNTVTGGLSGRQDALVRTSGNSPVAKVTRRGSLQSLDSQNSDSNIEISVERIIKGKRGDSMAERAEKERLTNLQRRYSSQLGSELRVRSSTSANMTLSRMKTGVR